MAINKLTLPAARKYANLTQAQLAKCVGVSESTIASWEKYKREPTISQAQKICDACGLALDDILFLPRNTV